MTALIAVLLTASGACADQILVGAPNPNNFSAWDTQSNVPPSGPVFLFADEFSISSTQFVTTIDVRFFGFFASTPFNLALVTSLDSASPLYSVDLTISSGPASLFSLPVNAVVPPDTYFLRLTTAGFVGWLVADATTFVTTFGTVADGIWERIPSTGAWVFLGSGGNTDIRLPHPGVFSVNGPDTPSAVPEPPTWPLVMLGLVAALSQGVWYRTQNVWGRPRTGRQRAVKEQ
jgi:hypothetical protein